jgi:hypothetical protein
MTTFLSMALNQISAGLGSPYRTRMSTGPILLTAFLPALWLHPFGPVLKNIPLAVATVVMMALEE